MSFAEQRIIGIIALVVNVGWLIVAICLVIAVKTVSSALLNPY